LDPVATGAVKAGVSLAAKPTLEFVRTQIKRRGADYADLATLGTADYEMEEALAVLKGEAEKLPQTIWVKLKGLFSERPTSFSTEHASHFICDGRVIALVKTATRKIFKDEPITAECQSARQLYAELYEDAEIYEGAAPFGERLLEDAVAFLFATLVARLTSADRILLDVISGQHDDVMGGLADLKGDVGDLKSAVTASVESKAKFSDTEIESRVDKEAIDSVILKEAWRFKRRRFIQSDKLLPEARQFEERLKNGLRFGSAPARAEGFKEVAAIYARDKLIDDAKVALEVAASLSDNELAAEWARIHVLEEKFELALKLVRGREDAASISMFIQAIANRDGPEDAISYFSEHHSSGQLTGHALLWLALQFEQLRRVEEAFNLLNLANESQIDENPLILFERGRLNMALAMAPDVGARFLDANGTIPDPADYHSDSAGQERLMAALSDFRSLVRYAEELNAEPLLSLLDQQSLSIRLSVQNEVERSTAEAELRERLEDPEQLIELAPLALAHGLDFDWANLRKQLSHIEKFGGWDTFQLQSAFQLALRIDPPAKVAAFVKANAKALEEILPREAIIGFEVEALAKSNDIESATEILELRKNELGDSYYKSLSTIIAECSGEDSVSARITQFEDSDRTHDLEILIDALTRAKDVRLGNYLALLWERKHQPLDAAKACDAYMENGQIEQLDDFLDLLADRINEHHHLSMHAAWRLQRGGELKRALAILGKLKADGVDNHNTRQLKVSILLELGRWNELEPFLQSELSKKNDRGAPNLMSAAQLAAGLESPTTMPLVRASLAKGDENPQLYLAAYNIALSLGVEQTAEVNAWLNFALDHSTEDGPVYSKDIDDAVEFMRDAKERHQKLNSMILAGELPLSLAASPLNATLSSIYLGQAWANRQSTDPRKHNLIPAFAGNRLLWNLPGNPVVSFDVTSLLTLQSVGVLDRVVGSFQRVVLPAGTLSQIFQDFSSARHPQPSRVTQARQLTQLIAAQTLTLDPCQRDSSELEDQVGAEFARLYDAARDADGYVIDTAPLHPPGKLKETVDPKPFEDRLVSPKGLIKQLKVDGVFSDVLADEAMASVIGSGEEWPNEPKVAENRPLYLTMIASHYLSDAGLLPKLKSVFGKLVILTDVEELAKREIEQSSMASAVRAELEGLTQSLATALEAGSVTIGRLTADRSTDSEDDVQERDIGPLFNALNDVSDAEIFVCDDRALNKNGTFNDKRGTLINTALSFDILRYLEMNGTITSSEYDASIEKLYESGFALIPLDPQRVMDSACASNWEVGPNAALRQIRNSIHLPLIRGLLKLPEERHWLRTAVISIAIAIRHAWSEIPKVEHAVRAANYLYEMIPDVRSWTAVDNSTDRDIWAQEVTRSAVTIIGSAFALPDTHVEAYRNWFDNHIGPKEVRRDEGIMEAAARALFESLSKPIDLSEIPADE
tara:strand:- start:10222 stop:14535 length:4314 start_codon:yes stop_codon:yes gene_type:complete